MKGVDTYYNRANDETPTSLPVTSRTFFDGSQPCSPQEQKPSTEMEQVGPLDSRVKKEQEKERKRNNARVWRENMAQMRKDHFKLQTKCEDLEGQNKRLRESLEKLQTQVEMKEQKIQQLHREKGMLEAELSYLQHRPPTFQQNI